MNDSVVRDGCHVIVVGNEKGGAGKTTTTMHLIASLMYLGFKVGTIDLDSRQQSLTRYLENRIKTIKQGFRAPIPQHAVVKKSELESLNAAQDDENNRLLKCMQSLSQPADFLVIDTPGSDTYLSRTAHSYADTVVTPINDSFVDLDVLGHIQKDTLEVDRPGVYGEMIWQQKLIRARRDRGEIDWLVLRNRLSSLDARNKRNMSAAVERLAKRIGFRYISGFGERVIYRELFLQGLTLVDVMMKDSPIAPSISHVAAKQELRDFLEALNISRVTERLNVSAPVDSAPKGAEIANV